MKLFKIKDHLKDPLYKNSFYLMVSFFLTSIFGFIFWIIAAKLYSPDEVGLGTALISAVSIICLFSYFGFDQSIIRFIPHMDKNKVFSTSITIVFILTFIFGLIAIASVGLWSQKLIIIQQYSIIFIAIALLNALTSVTGNTFIGLRKGKYYLLLNILMGTRVLFLFLFVILGAFGILYSLGLSIFLAFLISIFYLNKVGIGYHGIDREFFDKSLHFSEGNYIVGLLEAAPIYILPIIVLNLLGASEAAYYYIAFTIASILFFVPSAFSTSLFVEGSHGEPLKKNVLKSIISIFGLLFIGVLFLFLFGKTLLGFIGSNYVQGYNLLLTVSFSSFFYGIYLTYISIKKIQKKMKYLVLLNISLFIMLLGLSYIFLLNFGIIGVGYAFIIAYALISIIIIFASIKEFF